MSPRSVTICHDAPRVVYSLCRARINLKLSKYIYLDVVDHLEQVSINVGPIFLEISIFETFMKIRKIWKWFWQTLYENFTTKTLKIEKKTKKFLRGRPASWEARRTRFNSRMRLAGVVFFFLLTARNIKIHCRGDEPRSVTIPHVWFIACAEHVLT